MNRDEVLKIISDAREQGKRPDLREADLRGADLNSADLNYADLSGAFGNFATGYFGRHHAIAAGGYLHWLRTSHLRRVVGARR